MKADQLVTRSEAYRTLALSKPTGFRRERDDPNFPRPIEIGPGRFGFRMSEIQTYIDSLPRWKPSAKRKRNSGAANKRSIAKREGAK